LVADLAQIIKYEGDNATFVWKHPVEDFNSTTQLIVHESQEAVFFMNGQALDLFGPGRHTLESQNIPLVRGLLNWPTSGKTPFHCEVYFVNKTEQMAIKWGTDSHVQYVEPTYNFPLKIGASGEMTLRVENSRKLLVKIVGTAASLGQASLSQMFRLFLMARIKPYLAQTMGGGGVSIFDVDSRMGEISESLRERLVPDFSGYGLSLEQFFVTTIVKPEGDRAYEKFKELRVRQYADVAEAQLRQTVGIIDKQAEAQKTVIEAQGIAQKRQIEGYTYQQERGLDVAEAVARNEAVGQMGNLGIGLGMIGGVAGGIGGTVAGITSEALGQAPLGMGNPQNNPGHAPEDDISAFRQKLEKLKAMKETGILSDEEFDAEKKKLVSEL
jgi:membrane protease subunit (stomatin/prohibitin family)